MRGIHFWIDDEKKLRSPGPFTPIDRIKYLPYVHDEPTDQTRARLEKLAGVPIGVRDQNGAPVFYSLPVN